MEEKLKTAWIYVDDWIWFSKEANYGQSQQEIFRSRKEEIISLKRQIRKLKSELKQKEVQK